MSEADTVKEPAADRASGTTRKDSTAKSADAPPGSVPFEYSLHVAALQPTDEQRDTEKILLEKVENMDIWKEQEGQTEEKDILFIKNRIRSDLQRILRARKFDVNKALKLCAVNLKYFFGDKPFLIEAEKIEVEAKTGKTRVGGIDRHGRPVVVLDNSAENTSDPVNQMRFLMFNMELSLASMSPPVEKHVVFIHLENFSIFNAPSIAVTKKTIEILASNYCERLGHAVLWQPPAYFSVFLSAVSYVIDPITRGKLCIVRGDYSENSENDILMKYLIGDQWKAITGVDQPRFADNASPGYNHEVYWKNIVKDGKVL